MSETNRYLDLFQGICSVLSAPVWQAACANTVPIGYVGDISSSEHMVFNPVVGETGERDSLRGVLFMELYTEGGNGPKRALLLADILDSIFCGKGYQAATTKGFIQFARGSNVENRGLLKTNNALLHTTYSINFNYFRKDA